MMREPCLIIMMKKLTRFLSIPRISSILDTVPRNGVVADIGADHGIISAGLSKFSSLVYAVEMSDLAARNGVISLIKELDIAEKVIVKIGFGLKPLIEMEVKKVDSIVIAGVGANTMENILNNNQSCLNNYVSDSSKSSSTAYSAIDSLQVNNIILQPSHPYLASSLILFRSMSKKGWVLDEQRIDPMGNFYRITSRLRREAIMSSPATFSTCQNSNDSIFCSDYSLDLESWPLYRESILCSHCCNRQTCSRCRNWINYLRIQRSDIQKRQQAPSLNTNQQGNINSLLTGIEHHLSVLSDRCIQDTVDRSED